MKTGRISESTLVDSSKESKEKYICFRKSIKNKKKDWKMSRVYKILKFHHSVSRTMFLFFPAVCFFFYEATAKHQIKDLRIWVG